MKRIFFFLAIIAFAPMAQSKSLPIKTLDDARSVPFLREATESTAKETSDCPYGVRYTNFLDLDFGVLSERLVSKFNVKNLRVMISEDFISLTRPQPEPGVQRQQCQQQQQPSGHEVYKNDSLISVTYFENEQDLDGFHLDAKIVEELKFWLREKPFLYVSGNPSWKIFEKLKSVKSLEGSDDYKSFGQDYRAGHAEICVKDWAFYIYGGHEFVHCFLELDP